MPDLGDYGIFGGATDWGQSDFSAAFIGVKADGYSTMFVPTGTYHLAEKIQIDDGIVMKGEHKSSSVFQFHHAGSGFYITGANEVGGGMEALSIVNNSGGVATSYLFLQASINGKSPDFFVMEDLNLTSFSSAMTQYGIILDGNSRDGSAPNGLQGIRGISLNRVDVFSCNFVSTNIRNGRGVVLNAVSHYGTGVGGVAKLIVQGMAGGKSSFNVRATSCALGDVNVEFADKFIASGCDVNHLTLDATTSNCRISTAYGAISDNGSNNSWST